MDNKVVCGCFNVTKLDIENAIINGAKTFEEVQRVTNVGNGCGNCLGSVKELVEALLAKK